MVGAGDEPLPDGAHPFDDLLDAEPIDAPLPADPDGPAVIGFTSGTTRNPKGVIHSHRTLGFEVRQLAAMAKADLPPNVTGAPVGHFIGMLNAFLIPLIKGSEIHLVDVWDPGEVLRVMREEHIGMGGGATYFVTSLLDHPDFGDEHLALMPLAGLGGSSIPLAVTQRLADNGIVVYRSYGSTEHPSITGCSVEDPEPKRLATDGVPLDGVEIRLDEIGEIESRGPDLFLGYTDPELTASVFDDEGWYRTGDVGVLDAEGYLSITDRVSDVIIRGGENISAQEVEEQLLGIPGIAEAVVVSTPDDRLGERAAAIVRTLPDSAMPSLEDVRAHLAEVGLAKQKWPEALHQVADFPRTPSGKVQKFKLRSPAARGRPGGRGPDRRALIRPSVRLGRSASERLALADLGQRGSHVGLLLGDGVVEDAVGDDVGLARQDAGEGVGRRFLGRGEVGVGHRAAGHHGGEVVLGELAGAEARTGGPRRCSRGGG